MGLLDEISKLTTPASELPDLEDELDASSLVKPAGNRSKKPSNFNFEEGKYAGAAVSRKEIFGDVSEISGLKGKEESGEDDDDDVDDEDDVEDEDVEESDVEMEEETIPKGKTRILEAMDSDEDDDEGVEDEEDEEGDSGEDEEEEEESNLGMTTLSLKDDSDKADKATSVLHQRQVWDDLTYSNIRIHALLNAMNQMPRGDARKNLLKTCDSTTQKSLEATMENMAKLRDLMKTAAGFFDEKSGKEDSDDEEIPSDEEILSNSEGEEEDEDDDVEESEGDEEIQKTSKNQEGTSLKSLKKNLSTLDSSIEKFRSATITKWYNRTKVLNSKSMNNTDFSVFEKGSVLGQIQKVLADEDKLLKKVQTNRSGKPRIGAPTTPESATDPEIFDDSDFYQLLLKQMLDSRNQMSQSSQDGADMTRSYMELQSMIGNKKKRDVSQLSSKDRKLKYEPIAKLINFYPSKPSVATWTHESRNELFKSLFS